MKKLLKFLKMTAITIGGICTLLVAITIIGYAMRSDEDAAGTVKPPAASARGETAAPAKDQSRPTKEAAESTPLPAAVEYTIVHEKEISTLNRARWRIDIEVPAGTEEEAQIATMMVAARAWHRKNWPQFVTVSLQTAGAGHGLETTNSLSYAPDGCGISGKTCTGDIWTDLRKGEISPGLMAWGRPTAREIEASKEKACRNDLRCWAEKHALGAERACRPLIESMARFDFEWTDGWLGNKLTKFRWQSRGAGSVSYWGDQIKLQNGFGAWRRMKYRCIYNPATEQAEEAVFEGG